MCLEQNFLQHWKGITDRIRETVYAILGMTSGHKKEVKKCVGGMMMFKNKA